MRKNSFEEKNGLAEKKSGPMTVGSDLTELVFILDRSGSMAGMESDTVGGFNAVLKRNAEAAGDAVVSVVLFDNYSEVLVDRQPIAKVRPMAEEDYAVRGCTALLDAVGGSIRFIERVQKYLPEEARPDKTVFVITTDGCENASRRFSYQQVRSMIERKQGDGWEFLFLGAKIDAAAEAGRLGICEDRAATYKHDSAGTAAMYDAVAKATCCMRASAGGAARMDDTWRAVIDEDRGKRG
ncbi:MAG: VWA domain-containing protein [Eggerthellaceae bacterium]|nr:VWA domain-containing protein [Eggerthellaceae bacterium]